MYILILFFLSFLLINTIYYVCYFIFIYFIFPDELNFNFYLTFFFFLIKNLNFCCMFRLRIIYIFEKIIFLISNKLKIN